MRARRGRAIGVAVSLGCHVLALLAILTLRTDPPAPERPPFTLALAERPRAAAPTAAQPAAAAKPTPPRSSSAHATPAPPEVAVFSAAKTPATEPGVGLSDAELAGAVGADSGPSGGACDMARALQQALRKDALVQAAVAGAEADAAPRGRAFKVWNGDWVAHPGQDGRGLAAVREAILWEVGFAPKACRDTAVRGLVLISLTDTPGSTRLALGTDAWRWSDLLTPRSQSAGVSAR